MSANYRQNDHDQNSSKTELWIIDVDKIMKEHPAIVPVKIIDIEKCFGMYFGVSAMFMTDFTLAVTMIDPKATNQFGYLYEITLEGKMVR